MSKFEVLSGKKLASAIAGRAKAVATFTEREHQLAYSALVHADMHNDPKYLNALHDVTPANYRRGLVAWAGAFGNVTFDQKSGAFVYAKGKKSDLPAALEVAPANYQKAESAKKDAAFDEVAELERIVKRFAEKGASMATLNALKATLNAAKVGTLKPETVKPAPIVRRARTAPAEMQQAA